MPKDSKIKKVLVIGSGPIVIGQAAEFDYAGAQACRILREEGINVVLVNSNPATIMTDKTLADEIYLEPLNTETIARIIEKERPDGLLAGLGGQTGLNIALSLYESGILEKYNVKLLGTDIEGIKKAEDRELFRDTMKMIGQPCVPSDIANNLQGALDIAERIGYPVIVRPAFTLGGSGGGIAANKEELFEIAATGLDMSPITQVLIEKCISGWKEIEFETMRDGAGNAIAVCSMENVDPVGIHTGDSIVVAPALTLSSKEYGMLRRASLDIVAAIGIIGGCNCQFALDPNSFEYAVIEVNPRVSRSSALASKATGYPIAKMTARLALGYNLDEIKNDITGATSACFEPTVDYTVVKFPKWPFDKFRGSSRKLGTQMKATGEVMAIAGLSDDELLKAKQLGYTDSALKAITGKKVKRHISASYKKVDTCAGEFAAKTPYFYSTYDKHCESRELTRSGRDVIIVLGSGPIRIGQGIEFDYSSVHCVRTLREMGYEVVIINNNPETVSTDYDISDRLYFEPLTPEDVMNVIEVEKPIGVVVAFGGQTAIKLTGYLDKMGINILGTSAEGIDTAEDRAKFDALLESFSIKRPKGMGIKTEDEALSAAKALGYPILLRPSYVIGGQNMVIARNDEQTSRYMKNILSQGIDNPVLIDKYMPGTELEVDVISDGNDVLIPGIMEHIERAGIHSGDSIAVYPPYNLSDKFLEKICDCSEKLALALGTKGLVNIQYLIYEDELYVIEVNPRASRTVPYISKVTNIPMVDIASKVMLGHKLSELGYGTGLCKTPPYYTVKVPVFSFEKLSDANSILGPEMKSTGEVLGIGKDLSEALFKGLTAAGFKLPSHSEKRGILISVEENDYEEVIPLAKRFFDLGLTLYATSGTASEIEKLGISINSIDNSCVEEGCLSIMEKKLVDYILYTGAVKDGTMGDYISLHRRAMQLGIPCLTSIDTANALADMIESGFNCKNTELVDICSMRKQRQKIAFTKMHSCGNDYIFIENFDNIITCPESLCVSLCDRNYGIGGDGIVLIEHSEAANAKMRTFNRDGSEGSMAGNNLRCVAKYLYDNGIVKNEDMTIETASGNRSLRVFTRDGKVSSVTVDMGKPDFSASSVGADINSAEMTAYPIGIDGENYSVTCLSVGNPHCVLFSESIETLDLEELGPKFEYSELFPNRINTEFVRVINRKSLRVRVWERGNGETLSCGTGACAAVAAAIKNGLCDPDCDVSVRLNGGELTVSCKENGIFLTGNAVTVFEGVFEY